MLVRKLENQNSMDAKRLAFIALRSVVQDVSGWIAQSSINNALNYQPHILSVAINTIHQPISSMRVEYYKSMTAPCLYCLLRTRYAETSMQLDIT